MEKKQSSQKVKSFLKKNVYYIIMAVCLLAIAAMVTVTVLINNGTIGGSDNLNDNPVLSPDDTTINPDDTTINPDDTTINPDDTTINPDDTTINPDVTDSPTVIVLSVPVDSANVIQGYSMDSLVWNSTLKHYAVHNGIDFGGNDGDNVYSAYDGEVISVDYDVLNGHTVTIKHSDTLSTVYSSLNEPVVIVGQTVKQGGIIATMGTTATAEYSLGAHVHFSVLENGEIVNPDLFMASSDNK